MIQDFKTYIGEGTLWGNTIMRSDTSKVRKEDEMTFFGLPVEYMIYSEGDKKLFSFEEALIIEDKLSDSGWRIPNLKDFFEVSDRTSKYTMEFETTCDYDKHIATIESECGELNLDLTGFVGIKSKEIIHPNCTMIWIKDYNLRQTTPFRLVCGNAPGINPDDEISCISNCSRYCKFQVLLIKNR